MTFWWLHFWNLKLKCEFLVTYLCICTCFLYLCWSEKWLSVIWTPLRQPHDWLPLMPISSFVSVTKLVHLDWETHQLDWQSMSGSCSLTFTQTCQTCASSKHPALYCQTWEWQMVCSSDHLSVPNTVSYSVFPQYNLLLTWSFFPLWKMI